VQTQHFVIIIMQMQKFRSLKQGGQGSAMLAAVWCLCWHASCKLYSDP